MRQQKRILQWQDKFESILRELHGTHWKKVFRKLLSKSTSLRQSLKKRSKDAGVEFDLPLEVLRQLILASYGKECRYCDKIISVKNMVLDHTTPLYHKGPSTLDNLQFICRRCNVRKGNLEEKHYDKLKDWLDEQPDGLKGYVYRKLSVADVFKKKV
jgi:5-methylcytosine-specific restriction endonuclease McrA